MNDLGKFSLYYDTSDTENHTIDAIDLANGLIGISEALTLADKILNGEESELEVKVKAPKPGSIGIPIEVLSFLGDTKNVLEIIGFAAGTGAVTGSVLGVLEFLQGKKITSVEKDSDKTKIKTEYRNNEQEITLDEDFAKLVLDRDFRKAMNQAIVVPIRGDEKAKVHVKSFDGESILHTIEEADLKSYRKLPSKVGAVETDEVDTVNVRFVNVNFEKSTGWQIEHLQEIKSVKISDEAFLRRVRANEDRFAKGDLYEVKLKTKETTSLSGDSKVKYEIERVLRKVG